MKSEWERAWRKALALTGPSCSEEAAKVADLIITARAAEVERIARKLRADRGDKNEWPLMEELKARARELRRQRRGT